MDDQPDLLEEAARSAVRDAIEFASVAATLARAYLRRKSNIDAEKAARSEQEKAALRARREAERAATRTRWAPANDPGWISEASLLDVAAAWCAAVPYTVGDTPDDTAVSAVRNCETRLRVLHPHAMNRYDNLRSEGLDPADAMRQASPFFLRRPDVHPQPGITRLALDRGGDLGHSWVPIMHGPARDELGAYDAALRVLRRGAQILHGLQAQAARSGLPPLGEQDQITALENTTNVPAEAIPRLVSPARRPWHQDFPFPIQEVLAVAAPATAPQPSRRPRQITTTTERRVPS